MFHTIDPLRCRCEVREGKGFEIVHNCATGVASQDIDSGRMDSDIPIQTISILSAAQSGQEYSRTQGVGGTKSHRR